MGVINVIDVYEWSLKSLSDLVFPKIIVNQQSHLCGLAGGAFIVEAPSWRLFEL